MTIVAEPLRILIFTQYFWPENFQINHLARGLRERGHEVTVLTGKPNYPGGRIFDGYTVLGRAEERWQDCRILRVPLVPRGRGGRLRLAVNYLSFILSGSLIGPRRLKGERFDVVLVYAPSPLIKTLAAIRISRLFGMPLLLWVQDLWPESVAAAGGIRSPLIMGALERTVRWMYARCDRVLVQSRAFIPEVERHGVPRCRIVYFPQSIGAMFRPLPRQEAVDEGGLLPDGFRVMFAGNIGAAQDFDTVLAAAERLRGHPDIHWVIIGDGRRRAWVQEEVERRGLTGCVHLPGRFPEEAMPRFFAHADALLVTLERKRIFALTIPTKVQAYLASGKPIAACLDGEGARVIAEANAGFCAPAGDPDALAESVLELYRLPEAERQAMGRRARAYSEAEFDRDRLTDQLVDVMCDAVAARHGRAAASSQPVDLRGSAG